MWSETQAVAFKSPIAYEILAYLVEHPQARDTLDGIVRWWLLEQKIRRQTAEVKDALAELVREGLVIESGAPDSQPSYTVDRSKLEAIKACLRKAHVLENKSEKA
jgi:hypothetical protein